MVCSSTARPLDGQRWKNRPRTAEMAVMIHRFHVRERGQGSMGRGGVDKLIF